MFEVLEPRLLLSGDALLGGSLLSGSDPLNDLPGDIGVYATADSYEVDNTAAQAKTITVGAAAQVHSFHTTTDVDWVTFTLAQQTTVVIETNGTSITGDTEMFLYGPNSSTTLLAYDDESGIGSYSRLIQTLAAGQYYLSMDEFKGATLDQYTIAVTAVSPDSYETDNTAAQAKTIATNGTTQTHSLHTGTDVDWMKFVLTSTSNVVVSETSPGEVTLQLYGPNSSDESATVGYVDGWGGSGQISLDGDHALAPGTYYIQARSAWADTIVSSYVISVTASTAPPSLTLVAPFTNQYASKTLNLSWTDRDETANAQVAIYIDTDSDPNNGVGQTLLGTWNEDPDGAGDTAQVTLPAGIVPRVQPYYVWGRLTDAGGQYTSQVVPVRVFDRTFTATDPVGDAFGGDYFEVFGLDAGFLGNILYWQVRTNFNPQDDTGGGDLYVNMGGTYQQANGTVSGIAVNAHTTTGTAVVPGDLYTQAQFLGGTEPAYATVPTFINSYSQHVTGNSSATVSSVSTALWAYQIEGTLNPAALPNFAGQSLQLVWSMYCGNDVAELVLQNPPRVLNVTVNNGNVQRSSIQNIKVNFSENVQIASGTLTLRNNASGTYADLTQAVVQGSGTSVVTWNLSQVALPDGSYTATLLADHITDGSSKTLDGNGDDVGGDNYSFALFRLLCDSNGDGRVNGADLVIWRQNFDPLGAVDKGPDKGDWNGDTYVNGEDLALWQQHYNPLGLLSVTQPDELASASQGDDILPSADSQPQSLTPADTTATDDSPVIPMASQEPDAGIIPAVLDEAIPAVPSQSDVITVDSAAVVSSSPSTADLLTASPSLAASPNVTVTPGAYERVTANVNSFDLTEDLLLQPERPTASSTAPAAPGVLGAAVIRSAGHQQRASLGFTHHHGTPAPFLVSGDDAVDVLTLAELTLPL